MKKVLVIGDGCSDIFRYGKCDRLSPEAPVPIFLPSRTTGNGGMAINVFENLKALGVECDIITNDIRPIKTRYVDEISNQMLLRVDEKDTIKRINIEELESIDFTKYDAVVISDYNKGFLNEKDIEYIGGKHLQVFIDTKKNLNTWCDNILCIKINEKEYLNNLEYFNKRKNCYVIVTKGKNGAMLSNGTNDNFEEFPIVEEHDVRDLSGAGDTFLAALVAKFLENLDIRAGISFANKCSSWVVTQKGVVVVDLNKIEIIK